MYILLCTGLDKKLTDWLVPMKTAYISEGVHTGKKKQVPELHLQAREVCSNFCFTSEDIQGSVEKNYISSVVICLTTLSRREGEF